MEQIAHALDPHFHGVIFQTHPQELARRLRAGGRPCLLIDVRTAEERAAGAIAGSVAMRSTDLADALPEGTTTATEFFVVGRDHYDNEVRRTSRKLRDLGAIRVVELAGGMFEWNAEGQPTERPTRAA